MTFVALGLGSNKPWQGMSSVGLLGAAVRALGAVLHDRSCSSLYRTRPMYVAAQDDFYNMVVTGFADDTLSPHDLLAYTQRVESSLGRDRTAEYRNGPRSMDIDIELFGTRHVHTADLEIPHPRIAERAFVLVPLLEILSVSADTRESAPYARMLDACGSAGVEKYLDAEDFVRSVEAKGNGCGRAGADSSGGDGRGRGKDGRAPSLYGGRI